MPSFNTALFEILKDEEVYKHLHRPNITSSVLDLRPNAWCKFHLAVGHDTDNWHTLVDQLATLSIRGLLKKYVRIVKDGEQTRQPSVTKPHKVPILGYFNTIAESFSGGGMKHSSRKRYVRSIMTTAKIERSTKTPDIVFFNEDLKGLVDECVILPSFSV